MSTVNQIAEYQSRAAAAEISQINIQHVQDDPPARRAASCLTQSRACIARCYRRRGFGVLLSLLLSLFSNHTSARSSFALLPGSCSGDLRCCRGGRPETFEGCCRLRKLKPAEKRG